MANCSLDDCSGTYGVTTVEVTLPSDFSFSAAYAPRPCSVSGQYECTGFNCGGDYGRSAGSRYDTNSTFTLVTQFLINDNTNTGTLSEIRRFYVQNGKGIHNSYSTFADTTDDNSITDTYCTAQKIAFGDIDSFASQGGLAAISTVFSTGFVSSIWDDYVADMLWLDSTYATTSTSLGAERGPCSIISGQPTITEAEYATTQVIYSNIKIGPIGPTFSSGTTGSADSSSSTSTLSAPAATQTKYGQCGGRGYTGPIVCTGIGTACI